MGRSRRLGTFSFALVLAAAGCKAILGLDDPTLDPDVVPDSSTLPDVAVQGPKIDGDVGEEDAADGLDAGFDADAMEEPDVVITYHEDWNNDPTLWNRFDLKTINTGTTTFTGAVFDGRYIYFAPSNNTLDPAFAARYDTKGQGFTITTSWAFMDTALLHPDARGFEGAFWDGRYVYFVPYADASRHVGRFVRFDPQAERDFNDPTAWDTFDTESLDENARGFVGAAHDGKRYTYVATGIGRFAPHPGRPEAISARLDRTQDFRSASAWQFFDTQQIAPDLDGGGPRGFFGAVYAKGHVYFVPHGYLGSVRGRAVRYDESKPFDAPSSWEMFDTQTIDPDAIGFMGGAFDGRHVYFSPQLTLTAQNGTVTRFDTEQPFSDAGSWKTFDLETLDAGEATRRGYIGAGFDGRYVYFVPYISPSLHGWLARFDSWKPDLDDPTAWGFFDMTTLHAQAKGMCGSVFDGTFMYFVPCFPDPDNPRAVVVRFYAAYPNKIPRFMPGGSFL